MTTQDTGLVEAAARAAGDVSVETDWGSTCVRNYLAAELRWNTADVDRRMRPLVRAVLTALLPHLSDESRKIIEEELK